MSHKSGFIIRILAYPKIGMQTRIMWSGALPHSLTLIPYLLYLSLLSHNLYIPKKSLLHVISIIMEERFVSRALFLVDLWLLYYYQSRYFWIWTRCKLRYFIALFCSLLLFLATLTIILRYYYCCQIVGRAITLWGALEKSPIFLFNNYNRGKVAW